MRTTLLAVLLGALVLLSACGSTGEATKVASSLKSEAKGPSFEPMCDKGCNTKEAEAAMSVAEQGLYREEQDNYICSDADFTRDGVVSLPDFQLFGSHYGDTDCVGHTNAWCDGTDINEDGVVDIVDFMIFGGFYGDICQTCIETDGGNMPMIPGMTNSTNETGEYSFPDTCNEPRLNEYYCDGYVIQIDRVRCDHEFGLECLVDENGWAYCGNQTNQSNNTENNPPEVTDLSWTTPTGYITYTATATDPDPEDEVESVNFSIIFLESPYGYYTYVDNSAPWSWGHDSGDYTGEARVAAQAWDGEEYSEVYWEDFEINNQEPYCVDTDGGDDPLVPGWVNATNGTLIDGCPFGDWLVEAVCDEGNSEYRNYECEDFGEGYSCMIDENGWGYCSNNTNSSE